MSVSMLDNISYLGKKADNVRSLFNTIDEMVAFNENYLPDIYECNVVEDGNRYRYNRSNIVDENLGKWRLVESGGSSSLIDYYKKTETDTLLEGYVAKEDGKGLSTNDFTTLEKEKLASLENYNDDAVMEHITNSEQAIADIQSAMGNATLTTTAQNLSEAINEVKTNCDSATSALGERVTKNESDIAILNGDKTVSGSVAKKVATCLTDAKSYTDQKIAEMASEQAIVCDEKPSYSGGITTYIKDGVPETTDEENIWFYYTVDGQLMQTIWITGVETTIVSAGGVDFDDLVSKSKDIVSNYTGDEADVTKVPNLSAMKELETKLQTDIDSKISGDEIYDGLDSTSTTSALSANQGRVLNESVNTKLNKTFSGDDIANKVLKTDSLGNVVLGTHDEALDATSTNSVQNKAIKTELDKKFNVAQSVDKVGYVAVIGEDGNMTFSEPTTLGGKAEVVAYTNDEYPDLTNVDLALDKILAKIYYENPEITSFSISPATTEYEIGTVIPADTITFSWAVNKDIKSQALTDCTIAVDDRSATYGAELKNSKTFVLTVSDGENVVTASKKISFLNKIYFGSSVEPSEYNSAFILGLSGSQFASSKSNTVTLNVGSSEYGYFAMPTSFGTVNTVNIGGFDTDVENLGAVSFTNASGNTSSYTVYRLGRTGLGNITMKI